MRGIFVYIREFMLTFDKMQKTYAVNSHAHHLFFNCNYKESRMTWPSLVVSVSDNRTITLVNVYVDLVVFTRIAGTS